MEWRGMACTRAQCVVDVIHFRLQSSTSFNSISLTQLIYMVIMMKSMTSMYMAYVYTFVVPYNILSDAFALQMPARIHLSQRIPLIFPFVFISELEALIFLHACHNSVEKAKACLDTYYTCRTHCPEFFGKRDVNGADVAQQMNIL